MLKQMCRFKASVFYIYSSILDYYCDFQIFASSCNFTLNLSLLSEQKHNCKESEIGAYICHEGYEVYIAVA